MKKTQKKIILLLSFILIIVMAFVTISNTVYAINPDDYKPGNIDKKDTKPITDKVAPIANTIAVIGTVVSVITLMIMGIKYMAGSVSEKAEYKKSMIPYLVGAIMIFGITQILNIVIKIVGTLQ